MDNSEVNTFLKISDHISNYLKGSLSSDDLTELFSWVEANEANKALFNSIVNEKELENLHAEFKAFDTQSALTDVKARLKSTIHHTPKLNRKWPLMAAASILLCLAVGLFTLYRHDSPPQTALNNKKQDLVPGGNKAILTLANGQQVILNGATNGKIANQGNAAVNKLADGLLAYNSSSETENAATAYNTMTTPRGGQYHLILADGTHVWLNAASSIKFPVSFTGKDRKVEITGEAYFEVAHDKTKPFIVASNGQTVQVLGTHFNINAYTDEDEVKTTLLEGSVKIQVGDKSFLLKPGEQSKLKNGAIDIVAGDTDGAVDWKNGIFHFNDASIESVMRQLSRWYDVDVKYEGKVKEREFSGEISRNVNASQILDALSFKKIHYAIEGKTIIIKP
ncbi:MAG: FecR family protein [Mucilaginibacter sp.]|nr:FecR family protein [Mucilaginibacter sp.]